MLLRLLVETSIKVASTSGRLAKIKLLAELLKQAAPEEIETVIAYLSGTIRQAKIGVGWATLKAAKDHAASQSTIEIKDVDSTLDLVANTAGKGSATIKTKLLRDLFGRATGEEQDFLFRLLTGELRQGALELIMVEAVAKALELPAADVRRAAMLSGDLGAVAKAGGQGLAEFRVHLFRPIKPMLAQTATDVAEALERSSPAGFEYKLDGESLMDQPYSTRFRMLSQHVAQRPPRLVTADKQEAQRFFDEAIKAGHEGLMVKKLDARYEAGGRTWDWIKVKQANTLDLVVLAAEWGHGRRQGWLSNLHLGARDPAGGFVMLGKTFKGMTDELLEWQTKKLQELETRRDGIVVYVRPELVVEVAFNGLQESSVYPGGLALRFARVIREILAGKPKTSAWDQEQVARDRNDCGRLGQSLWMEFMGLRNDSVTLVRSLGPGDLSKGIEHPKAGRLAVLDLLHEWIHHDRNHFRQLQANIQAFVWPEMGNCQKFVGD